MSLLILSEGANKVTSETPRKGGGRERDKRANWITFRGEISSAQRREEREKKEEAKLKGARQISAALVIGQIWID